MIQRLNLHLPINSVSLGQCSFNIVRELYRRNIQCALFTYGPPDLSAYPVDQKFGQWIERSVNTRYTKLDRKIPTLACWHISSSEMRLSDKQVLLSFFELDAPTENEVNIVNQQDHTFFTSSWSVDNFKAYGANNVSFVPLGLDENFVPTDRRLVPDDITHWILVGKHEEFRKMTDLKIKAWMKRYGGNREHQLTICVNNPFYQKRQVNGRIEGFDMNDIYARLFGAADWQKSKPFNINVLPHLKTNREMLSLYQSADVDLSGFSRAEGHNIPSHTATALGKWSIVSDCSAHKDWATAENSILVQPKGMIKAHDGFFFNHGGPFNSGNMYDFDMEDFDKAMVKAEGLAKTPNPNGLKLTEKTYSKMVEAMLEKIGD